jgi:hypothetical protein
MVLLYRFAIAAPAAMTLDLVFSLPGSTTLKVGSESFSPRWNSPGRVVRPGGCWNAQAARVQFAPNLQGGWLPDAKEGMNGLE